MSRGVACSGTPLVYLFAVLLKSRPLKFFRDHDEIELGRIFRTPRMPWPVHFPANCPPNDGANAAGVYYRFVDNNPPVADDFRSYFIMYPGREWGDKLCASCGLSVFQDVAELYRMKKRAKGVRTQHIVRASLNVGKIKFTPTKSNLSHHTWWVPEGTNVPPMFQVI
jgi:hypothetical protein